MRVNIRKYPKDFKKERTIKVTIEDFDLWSLDSTLAHIIHPALVKMKTSKQGTPGTDREDAPADPIYDRDEDDEVSVGEVYCEARWQYILDEMIWAFEQIINEHIYEVEIFERHGNKWTDEALEESKVMRGRIQNGLRLFGKYYLSLWS